MRMELLVNDSASYEDWRHNKLPHLLEVFIEFPTCRPPAALFVAHLMALQPRFYSISSSQKKYPNEVHLTVAVVKYKTNGELLNFSHSGNKFLDICDDVCLDDDHRRRKFSTALRCLFQLLGGTADER